MLHGCSGYLSVEMDTLDERAIQATELPKSAYASGTWSNLFPLDFLIK